MEENLVQQEEDQVPLDLKKKDRSIWIVSAIILTLLIPMITFLARPYLVGSKQTKIAQNLFPNANPLLVPHITVMPTPTIPPLIAGMLANSPSTFEILQFSLTPTPYPSGWEADLTLPSSFMLIHADIQHISSSEVSIKIAKFIYKGTTDQVVNDIVQFYGKKGWNNIVRKLGEDVEIRFNKPDQAALITASIVRDPHDSSIIGIYLVMGDPTR